MSSKKKTNSKRPTPVSEAEFDKLMKSRMAKNAKKCRQPNESLGVIGCCMPPLDGDGPKYHTGCFPGVSGPPTPPAPKVDTVESLREDLGRMREMTHALQAEAEGRVKALQGQVDKIKSEKDAVQAELDRVRIAAYTLLNIPEPKKDVVTPLAVGAGSVALAGALYFYGKKKGEEEANETKDKKGGKKGKPEKKTDYKKFLNELKKILQQLALTLGQSNTDLSKLVDEDMLKTLIGRGP